MSGFDELRRFAEDLGKVAGKAVPDVDAVLEKGALNIKNDLIRGAKGSKHFKGMAGSISYDSMASVGTLRYEVGPEVGRAGGSLGHIFYEGTSRGGGTGDLEGPLRTEEPNLERELGRAVDKWAGEL